MSPPFASVYFDCDSTLSRLEGIDELVRLAGGPAQAEVEALTAQRASEAAEVDAVIATLKPLIEEA